MSLKIKIPLITVAGTALKSLKCPYFHNSLLEPMLFRIPCTETAGLQMHTGVGYYEFPCNLMWSNLVLFLK